MCLGMMVATCIGFTPTISYSLVAILALVYAVLIWACSSTLTAGAIGSSALGQRRATLAIYLTLGYGGEFIESLATPILKPLLLAEDY